MTSPIQGLHHVTATVDQAQPDLDFYVAALGLRLVKKTVNFDNNQVYHFYYGTEVGTPGTVWTTFPYHGYGVRAGTFGTGQVTVTSFSIPIGSIPFWQSRMRALGTSAELPPSHFGEASLICRDPSGLVIELVEAADDRPAWTSAAIDQRAAVRGLHSVTMTVASPQPTLEFLKTMLGFEIVNQMDGRTRLGVNQPGPGRWIDVIHVRGGPQAVNGIGTVHHVAMAVPDEADQLQMRRELMRAGIPVTEVMDRQYFQSIYFREPGGVLCEIATMQPGFLVDEPAASLGQHLKLPAWEESSRAEIEAGLPAVTIPEPVRHATT
ncbi:MAG: ring-cleaving dioxygenase [Vicinamibacterales bacterium]